MSDRAALDRIRGLLLGVGYRITGSWADAEDATDESLARWLALHPASAPRNLEAWLTTVTTRLCLDRLRQRKREYVVGVWLPEPVDTALLPADRAERRDDLRIAILLAYEQLSTDERAAFVLREAYDLPYADIADALGAGVATVRQWVSRARHRLTSDLRPREPASNVLVSGLVEAVMAGDLDRTIVALTADRRGDLQTVQVSVADGRVTRLYFRSNPEELTQLALPEGFRPSA
ncbi:sigma-70 family RNA polymerase sigma factor [Dietzia sp. ANT_WB102]|uniref:sigma-70 family RNA polymerase sigma factor n=1 Tax=Dietzia sp. ANT_WB102 TaxID=2597345 RepID=UPI002102E726|nr:sigma-70 family RNA polymerase sigma factor [Dietzia sp. ANT_WB102]